MKKAATLACMLALAVAAAAQVQAKPVEFSEGTPLVLIGKVTSPPKGVVGEKKMQVAVGPGKTDYTIHFRKASTYGLNGQKIDEDGFNDGQWVRVEGKAMKDGRRIDAARVQVIGKDEGVYKHSAFYHPGFGHGYVTSVAGVRLTYPELPAASVSFVAPFVLVGKISDDTGPFESTRKVQVESGGNTWTLHVPKSAAVVDLAGKEISVHEVKKGQWVRASGWRIGDLRMRTERLENVGADEAYTSAKFYRRDYPLGYVELIEGDTAFSPYKITGTVAAVDSTGEWITIKDSAGKEHTYYTDTGTVTRSGAKIRFNDIHVGDTITVEGRRFRF
jgi:hypothetical protein